MARSGSAWCPGGRTSAKALRARPFMTSSTACTDAPAASRAASTLSGDTCVSGSICAWCPLRRSR